MPRVTFNEVFTQHPDGSLEPRQKIRIGGVSLGPGVKFSEGTHFGGVDFTLFQGHDMEADEENGELVISSIYE